MKDSDHSCKAAAHVAYALSWSIALSILFGIRKNGLPTFFLTWWTSLLSFPSATELASAASCTEVSQKFGVAEASCLENMK